MRSFLYILTIVGLASFLTEGLTSCSKEDKKSGILSHDEMIQVMTQVYITEHKVSKLSLKPDSSKIVFEKMKAKVFNNLSVSDSVFKKSFDYYVERPLELQEIYTALVDSLNLKEQQMNVSVSKPVDKK